VPASIRMRLCAPAVQRSRPVWAGHRAGEVMTQRGEFGRWCRQGRAARDAGEVSRSAAPCRIAQWSSTSSRSTPDGAARPTGPVVARLKARALWNGSSPRRAKPPATSSHRRQTGSLSRNHNRGDPRREGEVVMVWRGDVRRIIRKRRRRNTHPPHLQGWPDTRAGGRPAMGMEAPSTLTTQVAQAGR